MAELNARTDSFISLLLDVSGRARPSDLQAMSPSEAAEALRQYAASHPERSLGFDGDSLASVISGSAAAKPAPPAQADAGMFEFGPAAAAPDIPAAPYPAEPGAPAPVAQAVAGTASFGEAPSPGAPAEPRTAPVASGPGVPSAHSFEPRDIPAPTASDFVDLPPLDGVADASERPKRVPLYWWLLAVFLGWIGGLVGWLVLRRENPKGARAVLLAGVAVTLLSVALAVGAFFLGAAAFLGLAPVEQSPVAPVPMSTTTTGGAEASGAVDAGAEASATP